MSRPPTPAEVDAAQRRARRRSNLALLGWLAVTLAVIAGLILHVEIAALFGAIMP